MEDIHYPPLLAPWPQTPLLKALSGTGRKTRAYRRYTVSIRALRPCRALFRKTQLLQMTLHQSPSNHRSPIKRGNRSLKRLGLLGHAVYVSRRCHRLSIPRQILSPTFCNPHHLYPIYPKTRPLEGFSDLVSVRDLQSTYMKDACKRGVTRIRVMEKETTGNVLRVDSATDWRG